MEEISRRAFIAGGGATGAFVVLGSVGILGGFGLVAAEGNPAAADPLPNELKVWLWARPGLPSSTYSGPTGATWMGSVPVTGAFPSGTALGYLGVASTGQLIAGVGTQTGNDNLTAKGQRAAVWTRSGGSVALQLLGIPTDRGVFEPPHAVVEGFYNPVAYPDGYGGADTADVVIFSDANGEHAVLNSMRPYIGGWKVGLPGGSGTFPTLAALTRTSGTTWSVDSAYSATTPQLRSNSTIPASAGGPENFFPSRTTSTAIANPAETWYGNLDFAELDRFPNGDVLVSQYFSSSATHAAGVVVARLGGGQPQSVAAYAFPNFADARVPGGPSNIAWSCRNVTVDPTFTNASDYRFFVCQDAFQGADIAIVEASRTNNVVTIGTATPHGYGVGQTPFISGLPGALAALNTPAGSIGVEPIHSVPDATHFTMIVEGGAASGSVGSAAKVRLRFSAATVEMRYNAVNGTIEPVSMPFHVDQYRTAIGVTTFTPAGDVVITAGAPAPWFNGPLAVISKANRHPEGAPVPFTAAQFANGWGTVREPDAAFASMAGPASFAGVAALDGQTAYWPSNDYLRRVTINSPLEPVVIQRVADPSFESGSHPYTGFFTTVTNVARPATPASTDPEDGTRVLKVASVLNQAVTAPKASSRELFPVVPGQMYLATAAFLAGTESNGTSMFGNASIGVQFKNNILNTGTNTYGNVGGPVYATPTPISNGLWSWSVLILTVPEGASGAVFTTKVEGMGPYGHYFVDKTKFQDRNRMVNPGFEWPLNAPSSDVISTFPGFTAEVGGASIAGTTVRSGTKALQITTDAAGTARCVSPSMAQAVGGQSYTARGWVRSVGGDARVAFGIRFNGAPGSDVFGPPRRLTGGSFDELVTHAVAPAGTTTTQLVIRVDRGSAGVSVAVDDLSFEEAPGVSLPEVNLRVSTLRRGGPDTENGGSITSGRPVIDSARRRLYVPVVQFGATNALRYPTFDTAGSPSTPSHLTGEGAALSYEQKPQHPAGANKRVLRVTANAGVTVPRAIWNDRFDAAPQVDYSVRGWFRSEIGGNPLAIASLGIRWTLSNGSVTDTFGPGVNVAATDWTLVDTTVTSPATAVSGVFVARATMPAAGQTFWLDDVALKLTHGGQNPPVALDQYVFEVQLP